MNLIKSVFRAFHRFKLFSSLNLFGLALGLACAIVLLLYVSFEFSFDKFHSDRDRIFRVNEITTTPDGKKTIPLVRIPVGPDLKERFAEIEDYVRLKVNRQTKMISFKEKSISIEKSIFTDSNFFNFFSFDLKHGNPHSILADNNSIVLTRKVAERLFGVQDPTGSEIRCDNKTYVVTGVAENVPLNSHIQFDVVFPIIPLITDPDVFISWDGGMSASTFIKLQQAPLLPDLESKLPDFLWEKVNKKDEGSGFFSALDLEPLQRIHLYSKVDWDVLGNASYKNVLVLFLIGLLVLIVAVINYLFISQGTLNLRLKEFGVKRYLGIAKTGVLKQLLGESIFIYLLAGSLSMVVLLSVKNEVSQLFGTNFISFQLVKTLPLLVAFIIILSIISGLILYTGFQNQIATATASNFKNSPHRKKRITYVSAFQFFISIALISSVLIVYKQLNYALHKDLGFKSENVINISHGAIGSKSESLINELEKIPGVISASASFGIPGLETTMNGYKPEGSAQWRMFNAFHVDDNFFKTYKIDLVEGRNFKEGKNIDDKSFIINETLAKQLNWENPVGMNIFRDGDHEIIGVAKDFHVSSIYHKIPPLIISKEFHENFYTLSISINSTNIPGTIKQIEKIWLKQMPNIPFNYSFLDTLFGRLYREVQRTIKILMVFTGISILIAVLGLFGITFLMLTGKVKEIGIRRVNGAKVNEVVTMLNKDFIKWVIIAFITAIPITYYAMLKWLENFAYKTELSWWIFALAGLLALGIALLTVSWQSWKAATRNPVEALRYE